MARGYRNPGSAGLVLEMVGDMDPWTPEVKSLASAGGERGVNIGMEVRSAGVVPGQDTNSGSDGRYSRILTRESEDRFV